MKQLKLEKYIYEIIGKYSKILLLDKHTFELRYKTNNDNALMECQYNYPYLNVTLRYSDKLIKKWKNKEDIIPYIVHELCHPITDPLYAKAVRRYVSENEILDEREKLTDYICNIVMKNEICQRKTFDYKQ